MLIVRKKERESKIGRDKKILVLDAVSEIACLPAI